MALKWQSHIMISINRTLLSIVTMIAISLSGACLAQDFDASQIIRVELKPQKQATINSPMTGRVIAVFVKDGDVVKDGESLISFECAEFKAQLSQAQARVNRQSNLLKATKELFKLGSSSETDLNVLKAEFAEAQASKRLSQSLVSKCNVKAPFDGNVASLSVKNHSSLQEGERMIEVVGGDALDIEMIIPSKWMRWLSKGDVFKVEIDETGLEYKSKVIRFGGKVDPVTQSVKLYAQIDQEASDLLPGMSGTAKFDMSITSPEQDNELISTEN